MTLILGVDPSAKKIALVAFETVTKTVVAVTTIPLYEKGQTRQTVGSLRTALDGVAHFVQTARDTSADRLAYVEKPLVGRGGIQTTIKQAYVGGIIRACLAQGDYTVHDVAVSTWRKELGITATSTAGWKAATKQCVSARWPKIEAMVAGDPDLIDAAAIALYGGEQVRKARLTRDALSADGSVQGSGPDVVVRPARVRPRVR